MMPYIFCLLVDLALLACIAWLAWLVWRGVTAWSIIVMIPLASFLILPGEDFFVCPQCGHVAKVKAYKARFDTTLGVQEDNGTPGNWRP